jgi:hypothetical protein
MASPPRIRLAHVDEAPALSQLCFRSKAAWGYDEAFMALARVALEVNPEQIKMGDVSVATAADGSVAGIVALRPNPTRLIWTSSLASPSGSAPVWVAR